MAYMINQNNQSSLRMVPITHLHQHQLLNPVQFVLNPAVVVQIESERSISLQQFISDEGLVPSPEEELKRRNVIIKLKEIVMKWIKRVAERKLPEDYIEAASATILTYGSYGLGVHNAESDIDALCVGPWFASMAEDFFIVLHTMLAERVEVSDIHCIKDAKVPLMRFKFEGISIDLPYAQLQVTTVPENVDILNPLFLRSINETSWRSLSGVRANNSILQLVPDVKIFQNLLCSVKLWAKRRGVYGNLFGFFGGVHLAVLAAYICQRNPSVSLAGLISIFFKTFAFWHWPTPVLLQQPLMLPPRPLMLPPLEARSMMPIHLPSSPHEFCHSNITSSTFYKIVTELRRGFSHSQDLWKPQFDWRNLFKPFPYSKTYSRFVKICLSTSNQDELGDWVGCAKSRFRSLLVKLEELQGYCDPNPTEYIDTDLRDPNVVFYWGLSPHRSDFLDLNFAKKEFTKNLRIGYQGRPGRLTLSIVKSSQLPKDLQLVDFDPHVNSHTRFSNFNRIQQMIPPYWNHMPPHHFVGYLVANTSSDNSSPGVLSSS